MDISLPTALSKILTLNWNKINDFAVYFTFPSKSALQKVDDDIINFALKSITVPAATQQSIEVYTGGTWMVANGRPDLARIELTFRDLADAAGTNFVLYRGFLDLFERTLGNFKDYANVSLKVFTGNTTDYKGGKFLVEYDNLLIENVSQLSFDNSTEDQIAEFSVTFRGRRARVTGNSFYDIVGGGDNGTKLFETQLI